MANRSFIQWVPVLSLLALLALAVFPSTSSANQAASSPASPRILQSIDETKLVTLSGSTHRLAVAEFDKGPVSDDQPMRHVYLQLQRGPEQENALQNYIRELTDPSSPNYHQWLTAEDLGQKFGPAQQDIDTVVHWLGSHGLQVNNVSKAGLTIDISGTAGQIRETFHTEIHNYNVKGETHIANSSNVQIPAALADVVSGFPSLNDFMPKPLVKKPNPNFSFSFNGVEQYFVAPPDFATIYNVSPLYKQAKPITGKGQTIAVLEVTDVQSADVATFRRAFGLSSYSGTFHQIHPGPGCDDPGMNGAEGEAALDSEWSGAVAPDATVDLASCANTTNFGAFIAAQNLLNEKNPPSIMSLSYLGCEADQGPSGNAYINATWQQAAAEGVSVFVAAGDGGAAGCDSFNTSPYAVDGIAANGLASTPYNVATGGTDFLDTARNQNSTYWSKTNSPTGESAKSYIPETPWNDSCAGSVFYQYKGYSSGIAFCNSAFGENFLNIVAGSGAPSFVYSKPYWQAGTPGNPSDGVRDLPDISLFASNGFWNHALLLCMSDPNEGGAPCDYSIPIDALFNSAGGTSFSAPQYAGIQALINQKAGGAQGDPDPIYYDLAKTEYSFIFHDIAVGNNDVPCYGTNDCYLPSGNDYGVLSTSDSHLNVAYPAHSNWDFATGLGSVNVTNLVNRWP